MDGTEARDGSFILEVIACTVEDAVEAELGGASRLEIISGFDLGGLTPSLDLVRAIKSKVSIPLRVMLRSNSGYELQGKTEIKTLSTAAAELDRIGVDGIVLGFLKNSEIDLELTTRILEYAPNLKATFHHAFEDAIDKFAAIDQLKSLPQIDKILSHGGHDSSEDRAERLEGYRNAATPEIAILAGGGVNAAVIRVLKRRTRLNEFHVGSAARKDGKVDRSRVEDLVSALRVSNG